MKIKTAYIAGIYLILLWTSVSARTWNVLLDESGDAPTIRAAIDSSASGDTILVWPGTYEQDTVRVTNKSIVLTSVGGPEVTVIPNPILFSGSGDEDVTFSGFRILHKVWGLTPLTGGNLSSFEMKDCLIVGFRTEMSMQRVDWLVIDNCQFWHNSSRANGGALRVSAYGGEIRNCIFAENSTTAGYPPGEEYPGGGGALAVGIMESGSFTVTECIFLRNESPGAGAVIFSSGMPIFSNNTLVGNRSGDGAAYIHGLPGTQVYGNVFAWNEGYGLFEVPVWGGDTNCWCNAYWENEAGGGQWSGSCHGWEGGQDWDDIYADPQFCDPANDDYGLSDSSPLLPENFPSSIDHCNDIIGALGVECAPLPPQPTLPMTWGRIKARYGNVNSK